jgi:hypothetical protein
MVSNPTSGKNVMSVFIVCLCCMPAEVFCDGSILHLRQWFPKWAVRLPRCRWDYLGGRLDATGCTGGAEGGPLQVCFSLILKS